jgi:hypothetical protein
MGLGLGAMGFGGRRHAYGADFRFSIADCGLRATRRRQDRKTERRRMGEGGNARRFPSWGRLSWRADDSSGANACARRMLRRCSPGNRWASPAARNRHRRRAALRPRARTPARPRAHRPVRCTQTGPPARCRRVFAPRENLLPDRRGPGLARTIARTHHAEEDARGGGPVALEWTTMNISPVQPQTVQPIAGVGDRLAGAGGGRNTKSALR